MEFAKTETIIKIFLVSLFAPSILTNKIVQNCISVYKYKY